MTPFPAAGSLLLLGPRRTATRPGFVIYKRRRLGKPATPPGCGGGVCLLRRPPPTGRRLPPLSDPLRRFPSFLRGKPSPFTSLWGCAAPMCFWQWCGGRTGPQSLSGSGSWASADASSLPAWWRKRPGTSCWRLSTVEPMGCKQKTS